MVGPKAKALEEKLAKLNSLEARPPTSEAMFEIRRSLAGRSSILAAAAARAAARLRISELCPELEATFNRFLVNPVKTDPGCHAKIAAVEALSDLDYPSPEVFLKGIRHIQMEPSFGPPIDTADRLRASCLFALCRAGHREILFETVALLTDREPVPRCAAIKVLDEIGQESCELLLRLKALQGDKEPEVLGDCCEALINMNPIRSLPFVAQFLRAEDPAVAEEAALAIGNSRMKEAFALLKEHLDESADPFFRRMLYLPIGLTRCDEAFQLLLSAVRDEPARAAAAAVQALSIYSDNAERRSLIRSAVEARSNPEVHAAYKQHISEE